MIKQMTKKTMPKNNLVDRNCFPIVGGASNWKLLGDSRCIRGIHITQLPRVQFSCFVVGTPRMKHPRIVPPGHPQGGGTISIEYVPVVIYLWLVASNWSLLNDSRYRWTIHITNLPRGQFSCLVECLNITQSIEAVSSLWVAPTSNRDKWLKNNA